MLRQRREDAPANDGAEEHVQCGGRAHDDALADVGGGGVEGPEPVCCERGAKERDVVELGEEVGEDGLMIRQPSA